MLNKKDDLGYNQIWEDRVVTRIRADRRNNLFVEKIRRHPSGKILEIGCGSGFNAYQLALKTGQEVLAIDICEQFIAHAKKTYSLPNLRYEHRNFHHFDDFEGESFNFVVGDGILHHLYHQLDSSFSKIKKLLKPDGRILFLEPNIENPFAFCLFTLAFMRKWALLDPDEMAFSKRWIGKRLTQNGFNQIDIQYRDFLVPNTPNALINMVVSTSNFLEKVPGIKRWSQSIFIDATVF